MRRSLEVEVGWALRACSQHLFLQTTRGSKQGVTRDDSTIICSCLLLLVEQYADPTLSAGDVYETHFPAGYAL